LNLALSISGYATFAVLLCSSAVFVLHCLQDDPRVPYAEQLARTVHNRNVHYREGLVRVEDVEALAVMRDLDGDEEYIVTGDVPDKGPMQARVDYRISLPAVAPASRLNE
jgi:hypothetical protein